MCTRGDVIFHYGHLIRQDPKPVCSMCTLVLPYYKIIQLYKPKNLFGTSVPRRFHTSDAYLHRILVSYVTVGSAFFLMIFTLELMKISFNFELKDS